MRYLYEVSGLSIADQQTWVVRGDLEGRAGAFVELPDAVMRAAFRVLTDGKAVYGKPGVACNGPYQVTRMLIEAYDGRH